MLPPWRGERRLRGDGIEPAPVGGGASLMWSSSTRTPSAITFVALTGVFAYSFYAVLVAGQLSLAQAGLASAAAFASSLVVPAETLFGVVPILVVGISVGSVLAFLLGLPVTRLRGVFLAIATIL